MEHISSVAAEPASRLGMLTIVAHDLRQPMSAALTAAELVESYLDDTSAVPLARKHIALAQRCLRETLQLASDLLAMDQAQAGALRLRRTPVDVASLLFDACSFVAHDACARGIDVQVSVPRSVPRPQADRERLLQVLTNLCANAVKFTGRDGRVVLSAASDCRDVRISVSDTGPGLADEDLPRVFERYWQGPDARAGAGLGLTIAKSLVEAHGGRIAAEKSHDGGLLVVFTVPLVAHRPRP